MKTLKDVKMAYSGKPGCMCGCRGKYSYRKEHIHEMEKRNGYPIDPSQISDRSIKIIYNKILKDPNHKYVEEDGISYVYLDTDTRSLVCYFNP